MIKKIHAELMPLVEHLQVAGQRGVYNLAHAPYRGFQWKHRAYQRDFFVVAFTQELPSSFGTFMRREELVPQRRLVFHSDALGLDLVLRRRGSFGAFKPAAPANAELGTQGQLFSIPEVKEDRVAALIWDTPILNAKHEAISPTPIVVKLARRGRTLDDNKWESGFKLASEVTEDLIPPRAEYQHDVADWDVDTETENDAT